MIILTPRDYQDTLKWTIAPQNKIDTTSMVLILNTLGDDPSEFHIEPFDKAVVRGSTLDLPIDNDVQCTHVRSMWNQRWVPFETFQYAKARTGVVMGTGSREITLETPIDGIPNATVRLNGVSKIYARGGGTYASMPTLEQLRTPSFSLAKWIDDNKTSEQQGFTNLYEGTFSTNPWVRNIVPPDLPPATTPNDVYTNWWKDTEFRTSAIAQNWQSEANYTLNPGTEYKMYPVGASGGDLLELASTMLVFKDDRRDISVSIEKINNYKYVVSWAAPVRYEYLAASRERGPFGGSYDIDNFAFLDLITRVDIALIGKPYNTEETVVSYSLNEAKTDVTDKTESVKNKYPFKLEKSEVVTTSSTINGQDWKTTISKALMQKYDKGKYIVNCSVPIQFAIDNNITIDTRVQVLMQDGTYIRRFNAPCTFLVKTITKRFESGNFFFELGLMEV